MNRSEIYSATHWAPGDDTVAVEARTRSREDDKQYSLFTILAIWAAAALPMAILGWVVAPLIGNRIDLGVGDENRVAFTRGGLLLIGLIWQFVLAMAIVLHDEGNLWWSSIKRRCWLNAPRSPKTGQTQSKLWWWLVPLIIGFGLLELVPLVDLWNKALPFLGEPDKYSLDKILASDARKADLVGAWQVFAFFVVLGIFNTIIGEELLFRGILLPKMRGAFGKLDWLGNGVLFGLYHLHQPWTIPGAIIDGTFFHALPARRYHSAWFGIIVHSSQTVFFTIVALGLVLGFA